MSELFHMIRCLVQLPNGEDLIIIVQIPGGMNQKETLRFLAELEDEYGAVNIQIADKKDKRLWWST